MGIRNVLNIHTQDLRTLQGCRRFNSYGVLGLVGWYMITVIYEEGVALTFKVHQSSKCFRNR